MLLALALFYQTKTFFMIKELQIRPFARPLFIWIIGILLQVNFSVINESLFVLLILWVFLLLSKVLCVHTDNNVFVYDVRWVWGIAFLFLLFCVSVLRTFYVESDQSSSFINEELILFAEYLQFILREKIDVLSLSEEEKTVLATLTLGYREGMDWQVRNQFSVAGVAHLLSVSGFHVAIVGRFFSLLLFFLPQNEFGKWLKYGLTIAFLWLFVLISGMAAPAIRAALMISFFLTGRVLERMVERYNILFVSAFCMLVYNPFYLFDVGFQLTYLAMFSILYFQSRIQRLIRVRNPLFRIPWNWITVSISAQLGTAALCLYYFGQFSTVFLLSNLPLTLFSTLLIPMALVWMLLPMEEGWIYVGMKMLVEWLTYQLFHIVDMFSRVVGAALVFRFDFLWMLTAYVVVIFICLYVHFKQVSYLWCLLVLVLILIIYRLFEEYILFSM